jgi:hypothetical protein
MPSAVPQEEQAATSGLRTDRPFIEVRGVPLRMHGLVMVVAEAILPVREWLFATCRGEPDSGSLAIASPKGGLPMHGSARTIARPDLRVRRSTIAS